MKFTFIFIMVRGVIVCQCNGVSDRAVRRAVRSGAATVVEVSEACSAGACCGGCRDVIDEIIAAETRAQAAAAPVCAKPARAAAA